MRPLNPAAGPLLVPSAGSGVPLRAGAFVSVRVLGELGNGLYRVLVGGAELSAASSLPLKLGALHRARVEALAPGDPRLALRLLPAPEERRSALFASLGLPNDQLSRLALAALLAEGIRPEAAVLSRLRRAIQRAGGRAAEAAALAAALEAKGLGAEEEGVALLLKALEPAEGGSFDGAFGEASGGGGGQPEQEGAGHPGSRREAETGPQPGSPEATEAASAEIAGAADASKALGPGDERAIAGSTAEAGLALPPQGAPVPEEELVETLAPFLKALAVRAGPPADTPAAFLGLFNHSPARQGSTLLLPFAFSLDSVAFSGCFRVKLPYLPGGPSSFSAGFTVVSGGRSERWGFSLDSGKALRLSPGRPLSPEARERLARSLAPYRLEVMESGERPEFDGEGVDFDA